MRTHANQHKDTSCISTLGHITQLPFLTFELNWCTIFTRVFTMSSKAVAVNSVVIYFEDKFHAVEESPKPLIENKI